LAKNSNIEFSWKINITWISWNAYIVSDQIILSWENIRKYLWLPLFPDSSIEFNGNDLEKTEKSHIEISYYDESEALLDFRDIDSYEIYNLWYKSINYNIRLNRDNDFYYAKIRWFKQNIFSTVSNQILLSPQAEADIISPELSLSNFIKIPVYQKQRVNLSNYIYEDAWINNIWEVFIDFDLDLDSDGDWNFKNDRDNLSDDKINIIKSSNRIDIEFWKYDNIFSKKIWITIIDKQWNIWYSDVNFMIYTPTPTISSYSNSIVKWIIDEDFTDEPINLYRFRSWVITKILDKDNKLKVNTDSWKYSFEVNNDSKWLALKKDNKIIAYVNETTWKIDIKDISLKLRVLETNHPKNESIYPKLIMSKLWEDIFYEYLKVNNISRVKLASDFDSIQENWIYLKLLDRDSYSYYIVPESAPYNPGSISIYRKTDKKKNELFTIFNDWRVNTLNDFYKLEYDTHWDYIKLKLIDKHFNRTVWEVLLKVDADSVLR
jgi:heat shock protein HspQ